MGMKPNRAATAARRGGARGDVRGAGGDDRVTETNAKEWKTSQYGFWYVPEGPDDEGHPDDMRQFTFFITDRKNSDKYLVFRSDVGGTQLAKTFENFEPARAYAERLIAERCSLPLTEEEKGRRVRARAERILERNRKGNS
jgi:hypothetical protein